MRSGWPNTGPAAAGPAHLRRHCGVTLLEVIIAIVVLAAMTKFAMMKLVTPATLTLHGQARQAAEQVRRAQSLASMRKQRMAINLTTGANGQIAIACVGSPSCPADASLALALQQGVVLGSASAAIYFNSLGQPVNSTGTPNTADVTLPLSFGSSTFTVRVAALTGRVSTSP